MVSKRLKLPNFFNGVARPFPTHKGRNLKNLAKKLFSQFRVAKTKFHHFWPPVEKLLENPLVTPLKKFLPTPMHTSMKMTPFLWKIVLYYTISQHWWTTPMRQAIHSGVTQWCRWRGCRRCKRTFFDLVKIRAKSVEIWENFVKTFEKSLKIWANSIKIRAKMAPISLWFDENSAHLPLIWKISLKITWKSHKKWPNIFRAKIFRIPKNYLLIHLDCARSILAHNCEILPNYK